MDRAFIPTSRMVSFSTVGEKDRVTFGKTVRL